MLSPFLMSRGEKSGMGRLKGREEKRMKYGTPEG